MTNNLFFTCGFQREKDWIVVSNRERVSSVDKDKMISILNNIELNEGAAGLEFIPEPEVESQDYQFNVTVKDIYLL
jgi:hypothetical protein